MKKNMLVFLIFSGIAYASLIPFQFNHMPFDMARARFASIPYLNLGAHSRADWIANILLYVPLGAGLSAWLVNSSDFLIKRLFLLSVIWITCFALAVGIEFLQVFFPPRTVCLNDIIAEGMGALLGMMLWRNLGEWGMRLWRAVQEGGEAAINASLILYGLFFFAYSLFPFDFMISFPELSLKLSSGKIAVFLTEANRQSTLRCVFFFLLEACSVIPLGLFFMRRWLGGRPLLTMGLLYGGTLGVILEVVQFFLFSGTSQGFSILAKMAGFSAGMFLPRLIGHDLFHAMKTWAPKLVLASIVPYGWVLAYLNGWFSYPWLDVGSGLDKLNFAMAIPFYRHYFSTETAALMSIFLHSALYGVIGLGVMVFPRGATDRPRLRVVATLLAAMAALVMEFGKLFLDGKTSEFTNVLIAAGSTWLVFNALAMVLSWPWLSVDEKVRGVR